MREAFLRKICFVFLAAAFVSLASCGFFAGLDEAEGEGIEAEGEISQNTFFQVPKTRENHDFITASYMNPEFRLETLAFFEAYTGSLDIAELILFNSYVLDVAPALAFALCAEESAFNAMAFNRNRNETVDRGLFQLNSSSFPKLKTHEFYDPVVNAWYGISHLRWCLDFAGSDVTGLAMYNAGSGRVQQTGTPRSTLDYISRILKRQRTIEEQFMDRYAEVIQARNAAQQYVETKQNIPPRFCLLLPLGR